MLDNDNDNYYGYHLFSVVFITILPLTALLFLNGSIIATINRPKNLQRTQDKNEEKSTKILLCIVIIFLILHITRVVNIFHYYYVDKLISLHFIEHISKVALTLNSSVNFVIYSMIGSNFRAELYQILKSMKKFVLDRSSSGGREELELEDFSKI